jgi:hypothetical protein
MQTPAAISPTSPIPVPDIDLDTDEPVAVIPIASVAPLDGPPDGERINAFAIAAKDDDWADGHSAGSAVADLRRRVIDKPLTYAAAAFALGVVMARLLR